MHKQPGSKLPKSHSHLGTVTGSGSRLLLAGPPLGARLAPCIDWAGGEPVLTEATN